MRALANKIKIKYIRIQVSYESNDRFYESVLLQYLYYVSYMFAILLYNKHFIPIGWLSKISKKKNILRLSIFQGVIVGILFQGTNTQKIHKINVSLCVMLYIKGS